MNRRPLILRAHALLALAALALGGWAQASGLHGCASHLAGGPEASHIAALVGHMAPAAHNGHASHDAPAANPAHAAPAHVDSPTPTHHAPASEHDGACTCLGDCFTGAGVSLPADAAPIAPAAFESGVPSAVEGDVVAPFGRAAYLLPYATAPPTRA